MTVDVEDYFQVSAFEHKFDRRDWQSIPTRVEANVEKILGLFDAHGARATFFVLGWICERHPDVVRRIAACGHEIASHGAQHVRVRDLTREQFREDVERTRKRLEDVSATPVLGYRAPSFSIGSDTPWAHEELAAAGYRYSSSVFPIRHDHYGMPDASRFPFHPQSGALLEIPLSTVRISGRNFPCSGGGWFRLLPLAYSKWAVRRINERDGQPAIFYFHPWELDPAQPRVDGIPLKTRFRHYVNLGRFESRLEAMLESFRWDRVDRIYLEDR